MIIANKLRTTNRAEYILYMWQVEDIVRAAHCDIDRLKEGYLNSFDLDDATRLATEQWYADICEMMRSEGVMEAGHLQIVKNAVASLDELHNRLLASEKFPYYRSMYHRVLPHIVELRRKKGADKDCSEVETCLECLYGVLMLRLQKREISEETAGAVKEISTMLGQLSDYYFKDKEEPIEP